MSELASNRLWEGTPNDLPSPYARMIPGTSAMPHPRRASTAFASAPYSTTLAARPEVEATSSQRQGTVRTESSTQPATDRFTLGQMIAADLIALTTSCGTLSLLFPAWSLPWTYVPVFAVLVTLFAFTQGLYRQDGDPFPADTRSVLARSILLAVGLVFVAGWGGIRLIA